MWLKKWKIIRVLLYIAFFIFCITSCIEDIPLQSESDAMKLFVVCEMTAGQDIIADITFTGDTKGVSPSQLMRPDTFDFSISEGEKDFGIPFQYDEMIKKFVIKKESLQLVTGEKYKFRGIGIIKNLGEPVISIPQGLKTDTIIVKNVIRSIIDGKHLTQLECEIKIAKPANSQSYFYIIPVNEAKNTYQVKSFLKDHSAFKRLKNKPGFLVDYSRMSDDNITLILEISDDKESSVVDFSLLNTSKSFYEYNYYMSNNTGSPTNESPPIAAFNIKTDQAYGSFSAKSMSQTVVRFK